MAQRLYRATLLVLYQLSIALGIALLPIALLTRRVGLPIPIHRVVQRLGAAYEKAAES